MNMKSLMPHLKLLSLGLFALATAATAADPTNDSVRIEVDGASVIHRMAGGIGASWHAIETPIPVVGDRSHGGSGWGGYPPADDEAAWRQILGHADWLGLDFCRVEIEQRIYEPERNQFTWDSPEMQILYRILDWCERRQVDVFFQQMWGNVAWNAFPEFRGDAIQRVHSGPHSMDDFADGLAALMKHLTRTKRYTCIRWLCINNEPGHDWSWWQRPPNEPMPLRDGLAAVRRALDREGVRVPLSGPDWTDLPALQPAKVNFDEFIGAYDLHSYFANFDWGDKKGYPMSVAEERLRAWRTWASARGKPLFLSELGSMVFGWGGSHPGPASFEAALKDAELVVRALNLGVDGFNRWSFINRGDLDGHWQMIETWDRERKALRRDITPAPNSYFVYGLLSRLVAKHSSVLRCQTRGGQSDGFPRVFAAALRSPKGEITWAIVNDAPRAWNASLSANQINRSRLFKYQITAEQSDRPNLEIQPLGRIETSRSTTMLQETLPPRSLTVFSSCELKHSSPGIIAE